MKGYRKLAAAALAMTPVVKEGIRRAHKVEPKEPLEPGIPDRLSISYSSPFFHGGISSMVGVEVDGVLVANCYEYCVSGGWYKVKEGFGRASGKLYSRDIRPFWRVQPSRQVLKRLRRG